MRKAFILGVSGFFVLLLAGWFFMRPLNSQESSFTCRRVESLPGEKVSSGSSLIAFENVARGIFTDYEGDTIHLTDFVGTPLVINSWAVWCPFCRRELLDFATVQKEFDGAVKIIAIDRQESLDAVKSYTDELGVSDDLLFLLDREDSFYRAIGGFTMPESIFVDATGNILFHKRGPMDLEEICRRVKDLL